MQLTLLNLSGVHPASSSQTVRQISGGDVYQMLGGPSVAMLPCCHLSAGCLQ